MPIIYLTGSRGSGKSTIGRMLASQLNCQFKDLDQELCERENKTVQEIVAESGWPGFRQMESDILEQVSNQFINRQVVISTGGGIVLSEINRKHLTEHGHVVWLKAPAEILHTRLSRNPQLELRPALTNLNPLEEIRKILREREPLYAACSHQQIDASQNPLTICKEIRDFLKLK